MMMAYLFVFNEPPYNNTVNEIKSIFVFLKLLRNKATINM